MTTRTIAKGIPPRQHKPKGKAKPHTNNGSTKNITKPKKKQSNKRMASDYESDDEEESTSADDSDSTTQGKKKRQHVEDPESENEIVDEDGEPPAKEVEEIDDDDDKDVVRGHPFRPPSPTPTAYLRLATPDIFRPSNTLYVPPHRQRPHNPTPSTSPSQPSFAN